MSVVVSAASAAPQGASPEALAGQPDAQQLAQACHALWSATLSLMVAFMHTGAPAHRYLLARRIARNFETLRVEGDCFNRDTRESFVKLAQRWNEKATRLSPAQEGRPSGGLRMLVPAFLRGR